MNWPNSSVGQGFVTDALLASVQHRCSFDGNVSPVDPPATHRAGKAFAALTLFALLGAHGAVNAQPDADTKTHFDEAMSLYEQCKWTPAFEQLVNLADGGHAEAARVAMRAHLRQVLEDSSVPAENGLLISSDLKPKL